MRLIIYFVLELNGTFRVSIKNLPLSKDKSDSIIRPQEQAQYS